MDWQVIVADELHTRGWTLAATDSAFLERVRTELRASQDSPVEVRRAAVRCYSVILYEACGRDGTPAQRRAFQELWAYLYPRALFRIHDSTAAQDAAQQTLFKIYSRRTTCREPASFLRWCDQILLREIFDRFREQYEPRLTEQGTDYVPRAVGLEDPGAEMKGEDNSTADSVPDPNQDTLRTALEGPMRAALLETLRDCLENDRHVRVIVELFILDQSFAEAARHLHTSPLNVQVMKSRALRKLRDCRGMQQLVEDWVS